MTTAAPGLGHTLCSIHWFVQQRKQKKSNWKFVELTFIWVASPKLWSTQKRVHFEIFAKWSTLTIQQGGRHYGNGKFYSITGFYYGLLRFITDIGEFYYGYYGTFQRIFLTLNQDTKKASKPSYLGKPWKNRADFITAITEYYGIVRSIISPSLHTTVFFFFKKKSKNVA
jgi:hypothetical protein